MFDFSQMRKTTKWYYLTAKIDDFELYEVLEPKKSMWTQKNIIDWIVRNYGKRITKDSTVTMQLDEVEIDLQ